MTRRLVPVLILITIAVSGCGTSTSTTTTTPTVSAAIVTRAPTSSELASRLKLAKCLRAQGLGDVPDPSSTGEPAGTLGTIVRNLATTYGPTKLQAALSACRAYVATSFPRLDASPSQIAARAQQTLKFVQCMRSHGVNIPDPTASAATDQAEVLKAITSLDTNSPSFKNAYTVCADLRPGKLG